MIKFNIIIEMEIVEKHRTKDKEHGLQVLLNTFNPAMPSRNTFVLVFFLVAILCSKFRYTQAQEIDYLMSVLHAESAKTTSGSLIKRLEKLKNEDSIALNNGYLLMADNYGNVMEFSGDTLIVPGLVSRSFLTTPKNKQFDTDFIFETKKQFRFHWGAVTALAPPLRYIYPYYPQEGQVQIKADQPTCLWWTSQFGNSVDSVHRLVIYDVFDTEIINISAQGNQIMIDLSQFNTMTTQLEFDSNENKELRIYRVYISDVAGNNQAIDDLFLKRVDIGIQVTPCNASKSVEFLQVGVSLERIGRLDEAHEFYKKAVESSDRKIYQDLLRNFEIRNSIGD